MVRRWDQNPEHNRIKCGTYQIPNNEIFAQLFVLCAQIRKPIKENSKDE